MKKFSLLSISFLFMVITYSQKVGIGTSTPDSTLTVAGSANITGSIRATKLQISTGAGANKILQSDNAGRASWVTPSFGNTVHTVGESVEGGIIFWVTTDGLHGLIAETQDQGTLCNLYSAQNVLSDNANHSAEGKLYSDWRLPTKYELNLLYAQRVMVGGFAIIRYWSSTEKDVTNAWLQNFDTGAQESYPKDYNHNVRAIRSF